MIEALSPAWRRSSRSTSGEHCVEVATVVPGIEAEDFSRTAWVKSTSSQQTTDQCVELGDVSGYVAVRDSKDPDGPKLILEGPAWRTLRDEIKTGGFDQA